MKNRKICLIGAHGTGKSTICTRVLRTLMQNAVNKEIINPAFAINTFAELQQKINELYNIQLIPEQFREVIKDMKPKIFIDHHDVMAKYEIMLEEKRLKQTKEITLATYAKQLYLENLYTAQGKNILCDRSVLDTFVYYDYFGEIGLMQELNDCIKNTRDYDELISIFQGALYRMYTYSKIYFIEPSDREIENDGFRLTDKKQQLEVHKLFLEYFKDLDNVEIVNQEEAHKEEFINKVVSEFII